MPFSALAGPTRGRGDLIGNAVQPTNQGGVFPDGTRSARENNEHSLECILGVLHLAQDPLAHSENQRSMPLDDRCEGNLIVPLPERSQQIAVGPSFGLLCGEHVADAHDSNSEGMTAHGEETSRQLLALYYNGRWGMISSVFFQLDENHPDG